MEKKRMKKKSILLTIGTVSLLSEGAILVNQSPTPFGELKFMQQRQEK